MAHTDLGDDLLCSRHFDIHQSSIPELSVHVHVLVHSVCALLEYSVVLYKPLTHALSHHFGRENSLTATTAGFISCLCSSHASHSFWYITSFQETLSHGTVLNFSACVEYWGPRRTSQRFHHWENHNKFEKYRKKILRVFCVEK